MRGISRYSAQRKDKENHEKDYCFIDCGDDGHRTQRLFQKKAGTAGLKLSPGGRLSGWLRITCTIRTAFFRAVFIFRAAGILRACAPAERDALRSCRAAAGEHPDAGYAGDFPIYYPGG